MININSGGEYNPVLIAMGANLPGQKDSPLAQLQDAALQMSRAGLRDVVVSRYYQTPCFPAGAGPDYVNAAVRCTTDMTPHEVLKTLHAIEADAGRARDGRWLARVLDLDLLAMGAQVRPDPATFAQWAGLPLAEQAQRAPEHLILPHPRVQDRAFVLVPLRDVAPDWVHPVTGLSVAQMVDALDPAVLDEIRPLS
jgi:2-amino-4-hydroxy-6-hydroxymethyldihydropteridine diphosphokinase